MELKDYIEPYLAYAKRTGLEPSTIKNIRLGLYNAVVPTLGHKKLADLKVTDGSYVIEEGSKHGKHGSVRAMISFRGFLKYLHDDGIPLPVHWSDFKVPQSPDKVVEYLTAEERQIIRDTININNPSGLRVRTLFELILHTGLRITEACSIKIEDIDYLNHEIKVENCKSKKFENVYIHGVEEYIKTYIASRKDNNPYLFVTAAGDRYSANFSRMDSSKLRKKLQGKVKKHFHWHLLRKTFCTELLFNNVDIKSVQQLARHASERTTLKIYAATTQKRCKEAHERVMGTLS
jgi:integrase/recombinase XerD